MTRVATPRRVLFVTGRLAEPLLRRVLRTSELPFAYEVEALKITVAALMTTEWIASHLRVPDGIDLVMIPGLSEGDTDVIAQKVGLTVEKGPKDLHEIPTYFGRAAVTEYGAFDIEIAAEINNAPRLSHAEILTAAERHRADGADIIDIGCTPGLPFPALAEVVAELRAAGLRVSVDTFDANEIRTAVTAGAELVLSVNGENIEVARDLSGTGARVVVLPDLGAPMDSLDPSLEKLDAWGVPYLIDPILEPIGFGFMSSLERFAQARRRYPDAEMLMGIGNLTELTAADSTGVNAILIAICEELGVRTVLTTEVIAWARGAVQEVDVARRLMHHAITRKAIPKGVDDRLVTTRDIDIVGFTVDELRELQSSITDSNFRIFADPDGITVLNNEKMIHGTDIREIFTELDVDEATHAFYLGKELARASLAVTLGKTYRQEGTLNWGYLTPVEEATSEHVRITGRSKGPRGPSKS